MIEYKCVTKEESDFQKLLNQWRNNYKIEILFYNTAIVDKAVVVSALITRKRKEKTFIKH